MNSAHDSLLQLAVSWCVACNGTGLVGHDPPQACECIYRVIFRSCYAQFRRCRQDARSTQPMPLERRSTPTGRRHTTWVRRNEDYCADFEMAARQALTPEMHRLFRLHYVLRCPAPLIAQQLHLHRVNVERLLLQVQGAVGNHIAHASPYSIYPPGEYLYPSLYNSHEPADLAPDMHDDPQEPDAA
jgi:hypothetical protein